MILIKIKRKGDKGSWFNKFVDNYFLVDYNKENFVIRFLSNMDKDKLDNKYDGLEVPRSYAEVREKPRHMGVKGIVNI